MLTKEKKRAFLSIVIGAVIALSLGGLWYWRARDADGRLRLLVTQCKASSKPVPIPPGATIGPPVPIAQLPGDLRRDGRICDPSKLVLMNMLPNSKLTHLEEKIADTAQEGDSDRSTAQLLALVVFGVFCLPLIWYLLLDRIREVSDAISGRDRGQH